MVIAVAALRVARGWGEGPLPGRGRGLGDPTRYLESDDGSPEAFFSQVLTMFAARVADQELESTKRRTRRGLELARQRGKDLGPPKKFRPNQVEEMRRMRQGGASLRRIASDFECSPSTVRRTLLR